MCAKKDQIITSTPNSVFGQIKGTIGLIRTAGPKGALDLYKYAKLMSTHVRTMFLLLSLIALEKLQLTRTFLANDGVNIDSFKHIDPKLLKAVCCYLMEVGIFVKTSSGNFKVKDKKSFTDLSKMTIVVRTYLDPIVSLDKLLTKEYLYGKDVVRDNLGDSVGSADITSLFSFEFSYNVLRKVKCRTILDMGAGSGAFVKFLKKKMPLCKLYGMDICEEAVIHGKNTDNEGSDIELFVGDILHLEDTKKCVNTSYVDIVSFMFILHEFTNDQIKSILNGIKVNYPGAGILFTDLVSDNDANNRKSRLSIFPEIKFLHELSEQKIRTIDNWKNLFSHQGYKVKIEAVNQRVNQVCILFSRDSEN